MIEQNLWDRYEVEEDLTRYVYFVQDEEGKGTLYYVDATGVSPALIEGLDVEHYGYEVDDRFYFNLDVGP